MLNNKIPDNVRTKICSFLDANTDNLMNRILNYAIELGYSKYTSTLQEAWRASIEGLSASLITYLRNSSDMPELACENHSKDNHISAFGTMEARRHRERGVELEMFLGLYKYYVQAYLDVIDNLSGDEEEKSVAREFIRKAFNSIELAFVTEWSNLSSENKLNELTSRNKLVTNEKNKLLTIFESVFLPLMYISSDGKILNINEPALALFAPERSSGAYYYSDIKIKLPKVLKNSVNEFLSGDEEQKTKIHKVSISGREYFFEVRLKKMLDVSQKFSGIIVSLHDITEMENLLNETDSLKLINDSLTAKIQKQYELRMKHESHIFQAKKLQDMGMMINAIAHQWRQPLNAIGLYIQDIVDEAEYSGIDKEYLESVKDTSMKLIQTLSETIDDFRNFFKPDKDISEFEVVNDIVSNMQLLNVQLAAEPIDISIACRCEKRSYKATNNFAVPPCFYHKTKIKGYQGEFRQVFLNVLYNSIFAVNENIKAGKIRRGEINVSVIGGKEKVTVNITDNGTGISKNTLPQIFNPYFSTKEEGQGTGLGLYMSKIIVEKHMCGKISAESDSKGTTMKIELPTDISRQQKEKIYSEPKIELPQNKSLEH